jgi:hypothetical protein
MLSSACSTAPSDVACPSLPVYSPELQKEAAAEVKAMPDGSVVANIFMPDYGQMRAGTRACIKARGAK